MRTRPEPGAKVSKTQLVLAGCGVVFIAVLAVKGIMMLASSPAKAGPSDLAANPGKQDEILAWRKAEELEGRLGLSEEQTAAVADVFYQYGDVPRPEMPQGALHSEMNREAMRANFEQMRGRVEEYRRGVKEGIRAVLTPEQRREFEKIDKERMAGVQDRMKGMFENMMERRLKDLETRLGLTEGQMAEVRELAGGLRDAMPQMGVDGPPGPEMMSKMRETGEKFTAELEGILTPQQKETFQQLRQEMGPMGPGVPPGGPGGFGPRFMQQRTRRNGQ